VSVKMLGGGPQGLLFVGSVGPRARTPASNAKRPLVCPVKLSTRGRARRRVGRNVRDEDDDEEPWSTRRTVNGRPQDDPDYFVPILTVTAIVGYMAIVVYDYLRTYGGSPQVPLWPE